MQMQPGIMALTSNREHLQPRATLQHANYTYHSNHPEGEHGELVGEFIHSQL